MNEDNTDTNPVTMNLLFVDDEVNILRALRRLFRGAEYNVQTAESTSPSAGPKRSGFY
jgi:response regulator RpfG family c-di-GMP phosphodiesterase